MAEAMKGTFVNSPKQTGRINLMKAEEHYPKDCNEFFVHITDEKYCWQYLSDICWSDVYVCPQYGSIKYSLTVKH